MFEAASRDASVIVRVGRQGDTLDVQLDSAAMQLGDAELANQIVRLNTLAYLRSQLALRLELEQNRFEVTLPLPTEDQVQAYTATIDF
ncbi:MAG: DUF2694 domain-containing protein [Mycobacteriaceae bacterium]|nr:DUF2694 domain-containing protein [Mycobacteriaceae bacterium]